MIFLNSLDNNRKFRKLDELHIYGYCNYTDEQLLAKLKKTGHPYDIRGQFAYVYISQEKIIACVDHLATTNLYYTKDYISPSFDAIKKKCTTLTECDLFKAQKKLLQMYTVGEGTSYKEITRLLPEHFLFNQTQHRYMDFLEEEINDELCVDECYDIIKSLMTMVPQNSGIAFSAGKDSAFVAMTLRHFDKDPILVNIDSNNKRNFIDRKAVEEYENIGWNIEKFYVNTLLDFQEDVGHIFNDDYWTDGTAGVKSVAMKQFNVSLSGEIGCLPMRYKPYLNYIINHKNVKFEDLLSIMICSSKSWLKNHTPIMLNFKSNNTSYDYVYQYYKDKWNRMQNLKVIEKCVKMQLLEVHSKVLWRESQDTNTQWFNIFSDYNLYKKFFCLNIESQNFPVQKNYMYQIAKEKYKSFTDISWQHRSTGMAIHGKLY